MNWKAFTGISLLAVLFSMGMGIRPEQEVLPSSAHGTAPVFPDLLSEAPLNLPEELKDAFLMGDFRFPEGFVPEYAPEVVRMRLSRIPSEVKLDYNTHTRKWIDMYTRKQRGKTLKLLARREGVQPIFDRSFSGSCLPPELQYLAAMESGLNNEVRSFRGAAGLWQFMPATARLYGLRVNAAVDERLNVRKSTDAAVRYLEKLYDIYGDWHLVIAAYNCGPGNVNRAIRRAGGSGDFWEVHKFLPRETQRYVPSFIGLVYAVHYAEAYNLIPDNGGQGGSHSESGQSPS